MHTCTHAINTGIGQESARGLNPRFVRFNDHQFQITLPDQLERNLAVPGAQHHPPTLPNTAAFEQPTRDRRGFRSIRLRPGNRSWHCDGLVEKRSVEHVTPRGVFPFLQIRRAHPETVFAIRIEARDPHFMATHRGFRAKPGDGSIGAEQFEAAGHLRIRFPGHPRGGAVQPIDERTIRQRQAQRLRRGHGKLRQARGVPGTDFLRRQRALKDPDLLECTPHPVEFVIVLVGAHDHGPRGCVPHGPGLDRAFTRQPAVDEDALDRAVVGADDMMPMTRCECGVGGQVRQTPTRLGGEAKGKPILAIAQQNPALEIAIVLEGAEDTAPFLGLIDAHPGLEGEILFGQQRLVDACCHQQTLIAPGQLDAAGWRLLGKPITTRRRDVHPAVPGFDRRTLLTVGTERPPTDQTRFLGGHGSGHQTCRQKEGQTHPLHGRTSFPTVAGASAAMVSGARRQ